MKNEIAKILNDLYGFDPKLKEREKELVILIEELVSSKPDTKFNKQFEKELLARLSRDFTDGSGAIPEDVPAREPKPAFFNFNFMTANKTYIAAGALAIFIVALGGLTLSFEKNKISVPVFGKKTIVMAANINRVAGNAFDLKGLQNNSGPGLGGGNDAGVRQEMATTKSASGDGDAVAPANPVAAGMGGGGSAPVADKMLCQDNGAGGCIVPPYTRYEYVYKGEDITLPEGQMAMYKKIKGFGRDISASDIFNNFSFENVDMGKFGSAKIDNISFNEDREYGFSVYVNFTEGNISFNQNWAKWPHPESDCRDEKCYQSFRLKESDMLPNNELIAIADQFLTEYNIALNGYGAGEVLEDWKRWFEQAPDKANYYFPETISVVYPLILEGKPVLDEGGNKYGINVSVNVREKKASGVWNLASQNYDASMYDILTDQKEILEMAKYGGGSYSPYPIMREGGEVNAQVKEIELGTPEIGLVRMYVYKDNQSDELMVPSLVFPIIKNDAQNMWQRNIIVPLVKEIIDLRKNNGGYGGPITIMEGASVKSVTPPDAVDTKGEEPVDESAPAIMPSKR